jgi:hypothetical protein
LKEFFDNSLVTVETKYGYGTIINGQNIAYVLTKGNLINEEETKSLILQENGK